MIGKLYLDVAELVHGPSPTVTLRQHPLDESVVGEEPNSGLSSGPRMSGVNGVSGLSGVGEEFLEDGDGGIFGGWRWWNGRDGYGRRSGSNGR